MLHDMSFEDGDPLTGLSEPPTPPRTGDTLGRARTPPRTGDTMRSVTPTGRGCTPPRIGSQQRSERAQG